MDRVLMFFWACLGIACICAGYKLFCGLPAMNRPAARTSRIGVLLLNVIPGVLLALIGTGLLTAQAHGILSPKPVIQRRQPVGEGASWHHANPGFVNRSV